MVFSSEVFAFRRGSQQEAHDGGRGACVPVPPSPTLAAILERGGEGQWKGERGVGVGVVVWASGPEA